MSFEEKNTWIYGAIAIVIPAIYFTTLLGQVATTDVGDINYIPSMLIAIGAAIALAIVASIVISIFSHRHPEKKDERDRQITRTSDKVGFYVFSILVLGPLVLAMAEVAPFWIANAIYLAFTLTALITSIVKIVGYRRGF
jgi:uncharacterized protein with PQ loop repeat